MGFFNVEPPKLKQPEIVEFVIKDMFSYITGGYEVCIFVDTNGRFYRIWPSGHHCDENVYVWKRAVIGDKIRFTKEYAKSGIYEYSKDIYQSMNDKKISIGNI